MFSSNICTTFFKIGSHFEEVVQIFELKKVGGAPKDHPFAPLILPPDLVSYMPWQQLLLITLVLTQENSLSFLEKGRGHRKILLGTTHPK